MQGGLTRVIVQATKYRVELGLTSNDFWLFLQHFVIWTAPTTWTTIMRLITAKHSWPVVLNGTTSAINSMRAGKSTFAQTDQRMRHLLLPYVVKIVSSQLTSIWNIGPIKDTYKARIGTCIVYWNALVQVRQREGRNRGCFFLWIPTILLLFNTKRSCTNGHCFAWYTRYMVRYCYNMLRDKCVNRPDCLIDYLQWCCSCSFKRRTVVCRSSTRWNTFRANHDVAVESTNGSWENGSPATTLVEKSTPIEQFDVPASSHDTRPKTRQSVTSIRSHPRLSSALPTTAR